MYQEEGLLTDPKDICASILNKNLFGIDIDGRAVQIAKVMLWMKAIERAPDLGGSRLKDFHDHIIATNIRLPKSKAHLETFLNEHPEDAPLRSALEAIFKGLEDVHELGSLIRIEDTLDKALQSLNNTLLLFSEGSRVNVWKHNVILRLREHFAAESQVANLPQIFFGWSANKGFALFDLLSARYHVVATNPPYMGLKNMGDKLKAYLSEEFPVGKPDLLFLFY